MRIILRHSAYNRIKLDWVVPTYISNSGRYTIRAMTESPEAFIIQRGFPTGEYLLIENRQPLSFDRQIPQGGLAIYHVDERANDIAV
jgi:hypothetical protein